MDSASAKRPLSFGIDHAAGVTTGKPGTPLSRLFDLCNTEQQQEFASERRSFRIHGHSTTIRLERAFWTVLEPLANNDCCLACDPDS